MMNFVPDIVGRIKCYRSAPCLFKRKRYYVAFGHIWMDSLSVYAKHCTTGVGVQSIDSSVAWRNYLFTRKKIWKHWKLWAYSYAFDSIYARRCPGRYSAFLCRHYKAKRKRINKCCQYSFCIISTSNFLYLFYDHRFLEWKLFYENAWII